ncbi:MAG TPA: hypothetical protein VNO30_22745 [Kofleriaceae bacterium]|nr:hypothetical protein [Kofleriaceae bacterium]
MNAENTRLHLLAQHERLREHLQTCTRLAKLHRVSQSIGSEFDRAIEVLREELAAHNETETTVVRELLHGPAAWVSMLIDRMFEEHVAEHAAFWELLSGPRAEIAARIDDLADELDAHMAAEERIFLAPATLRDDVLRDRAREERPE